MKLQNLLYPKLDLLPKYDLSKIISPRGLSRLKKTKIYLSSEEESERPAKGVDLISPSSFLRDFKFWLKYLKSAFENFYDLSDSFNESKLAEASDYFDDFQKKFKEFAWLSKSLKPYVEKKVQLISHLRRFSPEEELLAFNLNRASALELKLFHEALSRNNQNSKDFLSRIFYSGLPYKNERKTSIEKAEKIKETIERRSNEKRDLMMMYPVLEHLDSLSCLDNCEEMLFWKVGSHRYVMYDLYYKIARVLDKKIKNQPSIIENNINLDILYTKLKRFGKKNEK